jgi:CHRD domain-containing protein
MRKLLIVVCLCLLGTPHVFADTLDTAVFQTRMLPDNEVPPVAAAGNSANATITVHVTRDTRGNINGASVTFDVDYTISAATTFTGLHIHAAPSGQNGNIVIDTGISSINSVVVAGGTGRISRTANFGPNDTKFVTGLMATPEAYYVNIHTTTNPGGFMRGQIRANRLVLRPSMSTANEVPPIPLDAEGAALVEIQVTRDIVTGNITSGTVIFDVNYRFPGPVTLTGLHLHNAAIGVNGPVVIDSGLNGTTRAVANVTRGNIFRIAEIDSTNTTGLAALTGLMSDPTQFYINMHTTVNPGGVIRGQLSRDVFAFFNQMTQAEEVPPTGSTGTANAMTYVRLQRDSNGNVFAGGISFNVNFNMGSGPVTFTGLHIHNAKFATNGAVVLNSGLTSLTNTPGSGSVNLEVPITGTDQVTLDSLRGLIENPELYYINIHTTQFPGGVIRSQMARETYHFKANMSTANEVPPITGVDTAATGWITARISRDANGVINGGTVIFDANFTNTGPITFTGFHIHHPGAAGVNAGVVINTGLSATAPVDSPTGSGNITRVVDVPSTNAAGLAALSALISAPDTAYVNLHTTQFAGGVVRSQLFPVLNAVAQAAGGGEWISSITISNPSATASVQGIVNLFQTSGTPFPEALSDPNIPFLIPPSGTVTINTHNLGTLTGGFARIYSNGTVNVGVRYLHPAFTSAAAAATSITSRSISIPVAVGTPSAFSNTGIALLANTTGTLTLSLTSSSGAAIAGGSRTIDVTAGQQIIGFVRDLLPGVTATQFSGTLTVSGLTGSTLSGLAMQFDGTLAPVTITALP